MLLENLIGYEKTNGERAISWFLKVSVNELIINIPTPSYRQIGWDF